MVSPIRNLHQMNRQHPLQETCTQEVPPLRVANPCFQTQGHPPRELMKQTETLKALHFPHRDLPERFNLEFTQECQRSSSAKYYGEQQRNQVSGMHFDKFHNFATFPVLEDELQDRRMFLFYIQNTNRKTSLLRGETCCKICQNGGRISQKIWWPKECQHQGIHP